MRLTKERFLRDVEKHEMTVLQDNKVYRHIRFARPGDGVYHFELTTFPDHLVITGDRGSYVFRRQYDMFEYFRTTGLEINAEYWATKLEARDLWNGVREFSGELTKKNLIEDFEEWLESLDDEEKEDARQEFREKILRFCEDEDDFAILGDTALNCGYKCEPCQFRATEFTDGFLRCLYAITWGIQQYDKETGKMRDFTDAEHMKQGGKSR